MRIFKRKGTYYLDYTDAQGKRHRESTGTGEKKLAERISSKRDVEILEQKKMGIKPTKTILLSEFIKEYLKMSEVNKVPHAVEMDIIALRNFKEILGDVYLNEIRERHIEDYKIKRLKQIAPATVHREMNTVKNMFKIALRRGIINEDPCLYVKKPQEPPGRVRYLAKEEIPLLLNECKKIPYLYLFVVIGLNTGMRKSEILGLKWSDIDFENKLIHLEKTKNRERADILINSTTEEALKTYQKENGFNDKIFPVKELKKSFKGAKDRAGITNFRIHDLRHTFASYLVMNNIPLSVVKELMRHKSFKMTLRYAHLSPQQKRFAVEKLTKIYHDK